MQELPSSPRAYPAYTFDSAPEVSVTITNQGRIIVGGQTLAQPGDALRAAHALIEAYRFSQESWRFSLLSE